MLWYLPDGSELFQRAVCFHFTEKEIVACRKCSFYHNSFLGEDHVGQNIIHLSFQAMQMFDILYSLPIYSYSIFAISCEPIY
ncbi:hypothetical protein XENTR_v10011373 [Xenopus tropicalis]|nr:hypothetical protein XENTR_v10011373 [Xenopus tropicalis]